VTVLVGRLVDVVAALTELHFEISSPDRKRFEELGLAVARLSGDLRDQRVPEPLQFRTGEEPRVPLLSEMEKIVVLIPQLFASSEAAPGQLPPPERLPRAGVLVPGAFTNPAHMQFALKGGLAASASYVIYNAVDWPGISTAVTTCLLTAL